MVEIIDGGDRKDLPPKVRAKVMKAVDASDRRDSHATENVLRSKFDKSFKNGSIKRSFNVGISFDSDGKVIKED